MHVENSIRLNLLTGIRRINECASHLHSSSLLIYRSLDLTPFEAVAYRPSSWTFIYLPPLCIVRARTMWLMFEYCHLQSFLFYFFYYYFFRSEWDRTHLLHIKPLKITEESLAVILLQVESKNIEFYVWVNIIKKPCPGHILLENLNNK